MYPPRVTLEREKYFGIAITIVWLPYIKDKIGLVLIGSAQMGDHSRIK